MAVEAHSLISHPDIPSRKYSKVAAISDTTVIINSDISRQRRATEPRGKCDVRNMELQGNQEFKETNTKPEGKLSLAWTCLFQQRSPWETQRLEETVQWLKDTRADAAEKMRRCVTENPLRLVGTLDPRKEILDHTDRPAGGNILHPYESQGMIKRVNHTYLTPKNPPKSVMKTLKKI